MAKTFRHSRVLQQQLASQVDPDTCAAILDGLDTITDASSQVAKAAWAREVTRRMDTVLPPQTCVAVRERCACLLSTAQSVYAKTFRRLRRHYRDDARYLEEAVAYLNTTRPLRRCGAVTLDGDAIHSVIARGQCDCTVIRQGLTEPISITWCHCCKGSLLSVYTYLFPDRICEMEIVSTVASGGEECRFITRFRR
jgi:hypothetical protein